MQDPAAENQPAANKRRHPVIAIDGPAGAGKSTPGRPPRPPASGFLNLETGAMYRAVALKAIDNDISFDEGKLPSSNWPKAPRIRLEPQVEGNPRPAGWSRRLPPHPASRTSPPPPPASPSIPHLRAWMVVQQRALGALGGVVSWKAVT